MCSDRHKIVKLNSREVLLMSFFSSGDDDRVLIETISVNESEGSEGKITNSMEAVVPGGLDKIYR